MLRVSQGHPDIREICGTPRKRYTYIDVIKHIGQKNKWGIIIQEQFEFILKETQRL